MQVKTYLDRLLPAAHRAGFHSRIIATIGEHELPVLIREGPANAPRVYISAGIHGDEPAGPMAILDLLRKRAFPPACSLVLVPILNPTGLEAGTRENDKGIDLNRDYGRTARSLEVLGHKKWIQNQLFDLALCLHEDFDAKGAYLYELKSIDQSSWAEAMLQAMEPHVGIDDAEMIDGMPARNGLMAPPLDNLTPERADLPEALLLYHHHTPRCYTLETPAGQNIVRRMAALQAAVLRAVDCLLKDGDA